MVRCFASHSRVGFILQFRNLIFLIILLAVIAIEEFLHANEYQKCLHESTLAEVKQMKVRLAEVKQAEGTSAEVNQAEVKSAEVKQAEMKQTEMNQAEVTNTSSVSTNRLSPPEPIKFNFSWSWLPKWDLPPDVAKRAQPQKEVVNSFNFTFSLTPVGVCNSSGPFLLIVVPSVYSHEAVRVAIRSTWGSDAARFLDQKKSNFSRLVFLFGSCPDGICSSQLQREAAIFNDVIQGDFNDTYDNLPVKMLAGLSWIAEECPSASYVLKVDEDTFVNVPLLLQLLHDKGRRLMIMGHIITDGYVFRDGRFKVDPKQYAPKYYPPYAAGHSYIISGDLVPVFVNMSQHVPIVRFEDVYVTGLLALAVGVHYFDSSSFAYWDQTDCSPCAFVNKSRITATTIDIVWMLNIWRSMQNKNPSC